MKLCLSVYMTLLNLCRAPGISKLTIGKKLLSCLNEEGFEDFYSSPTVSDLSRGVKNLGGAEASYALTCNREELSERIADRVIGLLDENKASQLIASLQRVVAEDASILPTTEVDLVSRRTKDKFAAANEFVLSDALAGTLIYCASKVKNRGTRDFAKAITPNLLLEVKVDSLRLTVQSRPARQARKEVIWRNGPNSISVTEGDIFDYCNGPDRSIVVIPVDASFSTRITTRLDRNANAGISENTIHGKWLLRHDAATTLEKQIIASLGHVPTGIEDGIGDLAILDEGPVTYFLLATSVIEGGVARSSKELVHGAVTSLFASYDKYGQGYPIYLPLIGSGRSRSGLGYEESLRLILRTAQENRQRIQGRVIVMVQADALNAIDIDSVRDSHDL